MRMHLEVVFLLLIMLNRGNGRYTDICVVHGKTSASLQLRASVYNDDFKNITLTDNQGNLLLSCTSVKMEKPNCSVHHDTNFQSNVDNLGMFHMSLSLTKSADINHNGSYSLSVDRKEFRAYVHQDKGLEERIRVNLNALLKRNENKLVLICSTCFNPRWNVAEITITNKTGKYEDSVAYILDTNDCLCRSLDCSCSNTGKLFMIKFRMPKFETTYTCNMRFNVGGFAVDKSGSLHFDGKEVKNLGLNDTGFQEIENNPSDWTSQGTTVITYPTSTTHGTSSQGIKIIAIIGFGLLTLVGVFVVILLLKRKLTKATNQGIRRRNIEDGETYYDGNTTKLLQDTTRERERVRREDMGHLGTIEMTIERIQRELTQKDDEIRQKDEDFRKAKKLITQKDKELRSKETEFKKKDEEIKKQKEELRVAKNEVELKDKELRNKDQELRNKDQELRTKDEIIRMMYEEIRKKDAEIRQKDEKKRHKDEEFMQQDKVTKQINKESGKQEDEFGKMPVEEIITSLKEELKLVTKFLEEGGYQKATESQLEETEVKEDMEI